jgi:xylulokinase
MRRVVLGLDLGTTGLKAVAVDILDGTVLASPTAHYSVSIPFGGYSEQSPEDWRSALKEVCSVVRQELPAGSQIIGIGLSGQMHGSVLYDKDGTTLGPVILWNDQRTEAECEEIVRLTDGRVLEWTWNEPRTAFTASKLLWIRKHQPETFARILHVTLPKDYLRFLLTGTYATDVTDASGTNLLDVAARSWSQDLLNALSIDPAILPEVFESPEITGTVTKIAAAEFGLPTGIPVVAGGADQASAAIGNGIVRPGQVSMTIGTSGVVYTQTNGPILDHDGIFHTFCHSVPDSFQLMAGVLSAAGSLSWMRETLLPGIDEARGFETLFDAAEKAPAGARGLLFLPYLTGERSPHNDPAARGTWFGLAVHHELGHLARAVLEGVGFALVDLVLQLGRLGSAPNQIRVAGGGARSGLWRQIIADIAGDPVYPVAIADASAYGAAIIAASGVDRIPIETICDEWVKLSPPEVPNAVRHEHYKELHSVYRELYVASADQMHALSRLDRCEVQG